ncbi:MAG: TonB-dependent receptor [Candidatus Omnitrophica bacterium]|nr:TonB-dependent receptor [Candidatus Omnitrophota bacterium]
MKTQNQILRTTACLIFFTAWLWSENIQLPEEHIFGQDQTIRKSEIPLLPVPELEIKFPPLPFLALPERPYSSEQTSPETNIQPQEEHLPPVFSSERWVRISAGSYDSYDLTFSYQDKTNRWSLGGTLASSDGWRKHQRNIASSLTWFLQPEKPSGRSFHGGLFITRQQLPGPWWAPLTDIRESLFFAGLYEQLGKLWPGRLAIGERYYQIDHLGVNYLSFQLVFNRSNWEWKNELDWQEIFGYNRQLAAATGFVFQEENVNFGLTFKEIQGGGFRLLPEISFLPLPNLKLSLESSYRMTDFWRESSDYEYLEMKPVLLKPEERYRASIHYIYDRRNLSWTLGLSQDWWPCFYTRADRDGNFLYEPVPIKNLGATEVSFQADIPLIPGTDFYLRMNQFYPNKRVEFLPERELQAGLSWQYHSLRGNFNLTYQGPRNFPGETLGGYTQGNFGLSWLFKPEILFLFSAENLFGSRHQAVPGYPGRGRYFSVGFQKNF